jgi:hypothetical protein
MGQPFASSYIAKRRVAAFFLLPRGEEIDHLNINAKINHADVVITNCGR